MSLMIEGVLLYSSYSPIEREDEKLDLNVIFKNIELDLEVVIQKMGVLIQYNSILPIIEGSPILIFQLFYNLIANAIKFSATTNQPVIKITAEQLEDDSRENDGTIFTRITIQDNGIGFQQKYAEKIFQTFTRLNSKDRYEGTGLGLSLCKKIVDRHKGRISANSEEGKGASFEIILPVIQAKS